MSTIKVDTIQTRAGAVPKASDLGLNVTGTILQVQYGQYADTFSQAITGNTNTIVGSAVLTLNITPRSTSSIIKLDAHVFHEWANADVAHENAWFFYRDSTKLAHAATGNRLCGITISRLSYYNSNPTSTPETTYYTYFDSPLTTSQITYKIGVIINTSTTLHVNKTGDDHNTNQHERGISFISATEIGG